MIVVTGANGFIGSALCTELNARYPSEDIIAVDTVPLSQHDLLVGKRRITFVTRDEIWGVLDTHVADIQWIIHMGACSDTTEKNWEFLLENNVEYTKRLFTWGASHEVPLIYASSAATYGDGSFGFSEDIDPFVLKPLNLYGESKVQVDRWALQQMQVPPHWYGVRFFNVFGPNEYFKKQMSSLAYKAYFQIRDTGRLKLFKSHDGLHKDGEQLRDFVYIKDVTHWMVELMEKKPVSGVYNMGFGKARSWLDLAAALFEVLKLTPDIEFIEMPEDVRKHYQYFTEADMQKSFAAGLSKPRWTLETAITDYVSNYLSQDNKIY